VVAGQTGAGGHANYGEVQLEECHESYQIANSSLWLEVMCTDDSQDGRWSEERACDDWFHMLFQAQEDISVHFCHVSGKTLGLRSGSMYQVKVFKGRLSVLSSSPERNCEVMRRNGFYLSHDIFLDDMSTTGCRATDELVNVLERHTCCLHDVTEHEYLYSRRMEESGDQMNFTWRACLSECEQEQGAVRLDRSSFVAKTYWETLDDVTDRITDGISGAYLRFLPEDVWETYRVTVNAERLSENKSGVYKEYARSLFLHGEGILKAVPGFDSSWKCLCPPNKFSERLPLPECCRPTSLQDVKFAASQAEEVLSMIQTISVHHESVGQGRVADSFKHAFNAIGAAALFDDDRLMRFLCFVRQRRPSLFIGPPDTQLYIRHLVVGPTCRFLAIARDDDLTLESLDRIHREAIRILQGNMKDGDDPRTQVVILHAGSASAILQARIFASSQSAQLNVFSIDLSEVFEALGFENLDIPAPGAGFSSSSSPSLLRETGLKAQDLLGQLSLALKSRRQIRFLVTTALITGEDDKWSRQDLYRRTFKTLARLGYPDPLIVEAVHGGGTRSFLEEYGQVVYTDLNDFENQGNNEGRSMLLALQTSGISEDMMIIKLTGRYSPADRKLVQLVELNTHQDAIIRMTMRDGLMFTGCFAMKKGLLQEALGGMDWNNYELHGVHLEWAMVERLRQLCDPDEWLLERRTRFPACKIVLVPQLGVLAYRSTLQQPEMW